ncbi:N-6 DNA methylase [Anopheles sinensis]|uniref:N-6 DNA methylase n=1 Tax=Anopheles sinensis TaxID=74873 RepID=A0A084WCF8_ANOSI|nr:N-6 DNA methylase [Anopheles sinensis]
MKSPAEHRVHSRMLVLHLDSSANSSNTQGTVKPSSRMLRSFGVLANNVHRWTLRWTQCFDRS